MEMIKAVPAAGARERFAAAAQAHTRSMYRAARTILDSDAEDAVSEALLRAWQAFSRLKSEEALKGWLLKITVNCAREQRRKGARVTYTDDLEPLAGSVEDRQYDGLWDAVLALPEDQRTAVVLFYYEDMTLAQIASVLGVAQGTVKSRLCRARGRLREMLKEEL